ncbi:HNH endonuclease [Sinomonas sp. P10A9]|uniref:DUF222 domain-containing protein n=1 Tax=Sinomonas puerhi TaxID=3238584 RepID=A0AB39L8L7_9MICC
MSNEELGAWARRLSAPILVSANLTGSSQLTASALIDRAQLLEHLSSALAAEQVRIAAQFSDICLGRADSGDDDRRHLQTVDHDRRARVRSTGAQIALARRAAPSQGMRIVELSEILVREMPLTLNALAEGSLTEHRAFAIAAATRGLASKDRADVDRKLCSEPGRLAHLGDRAVEDAARRVVEEVDRGAAAERIRRAEADRHVSVRRLPDAMAKVTAILPIAGAMAVREALVSAAETAKAAGDDRSLGQLTADTLIERATGLADGGRIPLRIGLVMTDRTLLAGGAEPAVLPGYGTVPADWARELVARALGEPTAASGERPLRARERVWLERLFTAPETGQLVAMDSKARLFPAPMGRFLRLRDDRCRTSFCDAQARHLDHVVPVAEGGPTTLENGQCLCAFCNLTKESQGWQQSVVESGPAPASPALESQTPGELRQQGVWVEGALPPAMRSMAWIASCPQTRRRIADGQAYRPRPHAATRERPRGNARRAPRRRITR